MANKTYAEKLRDPRWQKKRLDIFNRDNFTCLDCGDQRTELQVHHVKYIKGREPWEYEDNNFRTLCRNCHAGAHFKPISNVVENSIKEPVVFPFDENEAGILRSLLLYGDLPVFPKSKYVKNQYSKIYEFIICELVRFDIRFDTLEFQKMYDYIASNYYNTPEYSPDIEVFLTNDSDVIQAFARYTVESSRPISPKWARFGVFPPAPEDVAMSIAIKLVFAAKDRKISVLIDKKQRDLRGLSYEDSIEILKDLQELDKIKHDIRTDKLYWLG